MTHKGPPADLELVHDKQWGTLLGPQLAIKPLPEAPEWKWGQGLQGNPTSRGTPEELGGHKADIICRTLLFKLWETDHWKLQGLRLTGAHLSYVKNTCMVWFCTSLLCVCLACVTKQGNVFKRQAQWHFLKNHLSKSGSAVHPSRDCESRSRVTAWGRISPGLCPVESGIYSRQHSTQISGLAKHCSHQGKDVKPETKRLGYLESCLCWLTCRSVCRHSNIGKHSRGRD